MDRVDCQTRRVGKLTASVRDHSDGVPVPPVELLASVRRDHRLETAANRVRATVEGSRFDEPVKLADQPIRQLHGYLSGHA